MKTKKILSIILVIALVLSVMSISVSAAEEITYTATGSYIVTPEQTLNPDTFNVTALVDERKIAVLEGGTSDFTYDLISFTASYIDLENEKHEGDYVTDPEAFFAVFEKKEADVIVASTYNSENPDATPMDVNVVYIDSEFSITFLDPKIFGTLDYTLQIDGFSAPLSTGVDIADDLISAAKLPIDVTITGNVADFPAIVSTTVLSTPKKNDYYDSEKFDATGLSLSVTTTIGETGIYTYTKDTAYLFSFNPTSNEKLSIYDTEVVTYLNGVEVLKTPISVSHKFSDGYVNITTYKYTETKPGYHAIVCEGCGEAHDAQPHVIDHDTWTYNNDQTFVANGTESTICLDCGTVVTRDTVGTADFNTVFADMHFIKVIFEYINLLLQFISEAIN